ncbi:Do family serine endopeptidase [Ahrensia sp. R2A130]|uniref:Do family serine endopeptidase n=1 Tax=Ahrensia sp. R2A130 TaxID=744979 RepID=UPI0001E0BC52|nr:Do family serine endopeptidase [Ahrensia sp. R2A130]EFL90772.1 serine protease [Ahrensia sp. R2A130]
MIKKLFITAAAAAAMFTTPALVSSSAPGLVPLAHAAGPVSVADLADELIGAVVNISTSQNVGNNNEGTSRAPRPKVPDGSPFQDFFDEFFRNQEEGNSGPPSRRNQPRKVSSLGSGFVIDPAGIIITNNHVIADADEIEIDFTDGTSLKAEVIGTDPKTDIAVLRVTPEKPLQAVAFGKSAGARVGDWVMAIGNPFGQGSSVTLGIVSATKRDIRSGPYDSFIQTDAAINRGNSGGPLFNMDGEVIGINTAIISPSGGSIGLGFSIPSDLAINVIQQLRDFGETRRGWLGVSIQPVTDDIAESLSMAEARGALVAGVTNKGPAKIAGIQVGDVILDFDGKRIEQMRDLPRIVAETPVGKAVDVVVLRKGEEETVPVTLGRLEDGEKAAAEESAEAKEETDEPKPVVALGMTFGELTDERRAEFKIADDVKGALITEVSDGSAAQDKGIKPGSVISEIGQEAVDTPADVEKRLAALKKDGRKKALLLVAAPDGDLGFVVLSLN